MITGGGGNFEVGREPQVIVSVIFLYLLSGVVFQFSSGFEMPFSMFLVCTNRPFSRFFRFQPFSKLLFSQSRTNRGKAEVHPKASAGRLGKVSLSQNSILL